MAITVLSLKNPHYTSETSIDCKVKFSHFPTEEMDYTATADSDTDFGVKLWNDLLAGKYGEVAPLNIVVSSDEIDAHRDSLIDSGIVFKGKLIQTRPQDRENIAGAGTLATLAIMQGAQVGNYNWTGNGPFEWICADNTIMQLDAYDVIALGRAAATFKQQCIFAARALKDITPNPYNYTSPDFWPSNVF